MFTSAEMSRLGRLNRSFTAASSSDDGHQGCLRFPAESVSSDSWIRRNADLALGNRRRRVIFAQGGSQVGSHEVDPALSVGRDVGVARGRQCLDRLAQPAPGPGQAKPGPEPLPDLFAQIGRRLPGDGAQRLGDLVDLVERRQPIGFARGLAVSAQVSEQGVEEGVPARLDWAEERLPGSPRTFGSLESSARLPDSSASRGLPRKPRAPARPPLRCSQPEALPFVASSSPSFGCRLIFKRGSKLNRPNLLPD